MSEKLKTERLRRGVYRVGSFEIWHEARAYWRLWGPDQLQLGGYRTLREAVKAAQYEQADD